MAKILIIGTGSWATALANVLLDNKQEVHMFGMNQIEINNLKHGRCTKLTDKKLLTPQLVTNKPEIVFCNQYDYIVLAVPSKSIKQCLEESIQYIKNKPIWINTAKGLNYETLQPWSKTIDKMTSGHNSGVVALVGPSFAKEVINKATTFINVASKSKNAALKVAKVFTNQYFHCSYCPNELVVQFMSSMKNVMAIIIGLLKQMNVSINTISGIFTLGFQEIIKIIGERTTKLVNVLSFSGLGDLYLTCNDPQSRNYRFGMLLAQIGKEAVESNKNSTIEGIYALKVAYKIIENKKLHCPLISCLYKIIYENKDPKSFMNDFIETKKTKEVTNEKVVVKKNKINKNSKKQIKK